MSDERPAARVGDPIAHSNAMSGLLKGLVVGLAVGVLVGATIATGGGALAVVAGVGAGMGLTSFGALSGKYIGEGSMGSPCGNFVTGSPNVMINRRPATMTLVATATCADHSGTPPLATGAATVFVNGKPAGRIGEKVGCSALSIEPASPNVMIGGPSASDPAVVVTPEVPAWAVTALQVMGVAGAIMALPYAIATVGVAATIGGGAGGYLGAAGLGAAGHALGKAMGLSETGVRSLEVGGQFLGGLVGGGLGTRGGQRFALRNLHPELRELPFPVARSVAKMPPEFQSEYAAARAAGWKRPDGSMWWPPDRGLVGDPVARQLAPGTQIDRYGFDGGTFLSPTETPSGARALAPGTTSKPYNQFEVVKPIDVQSGEVAPWFDEVGGGTQHEFPMPVTSALDDGYIKRVGP